MRILKIFYEAVIAHFVLPHWLHLLLVFTTLISNLLITAVFFAFSWVFMIEKELNKIFFRLPVYLFSKNRYFFQTTQNLRGFFKIFYY